MGERIKVTANKPLSTKENSASNKQKTGFRSQSSHVDRILFLQRTVGNQAVQRLMKSGALQAKLMIGQPGDKYEQEADRVAEEVMRMPEPGVQRQVEPEEEKEEEKELIQTKPLAEQITPLAQRQVEEEEELQAKELSGQAISVTTNEELRRQLEEEEEKEEELQTKALPNQTSEVTSDLESRINASVSGGQPLPASTRAFFEPRFGYDFSQVRAHTDAEADTLNRALNASAFTTGQDVFFRQGEYTPGSSSGRKLLAHELTHVVQQNGDQVQRKLTVGQPGDKYEQEAYRVSQAIMQQERQVARREAYWGRVHQQVEEVQTKDEAPRTQRQLEVEEELTQTKYSSGVGMKSFHKTSENISRAPIMVSLWDELGRWSWDHPIHAGRRVFVPVSVGGEGEWHSVLQRMDTERNFRTYLEGFILASLGLQPGETIITGSGAVVRRRNYRSTARAPDRPQILNMLRAMYSLGERLDLPDVRVIELTPGLINTYLPLLYQFIGNYQSLIIEERSQVERGGGVMSIADIRGVAGEMRTGGIMRMITNAAATALKGVDLTAAATTHNQELTANNVIANSGEIIRRALTAHSDALNIERDVAGGVFDVVWTLVPGGGILGEASKIILRRGMLNMMTGTRANRVSTRVERIIEDFRSTVNRIPVIELSADKKIRCINTFNTHMR